MSDILNLRVKTVPKSKILDVKRSKSGGELQVMAGLAHLLSPRGHQIVSEWSQMDPFPD